MSSLYLCVTGQHDLRLVLVAALICTLGVCTTFRLGQQVLEERTSRARVMWSFAAVLATASTIWATHFIAMLAFMPGLPAHFAIGRTLASLAIAFCLVAAGGAFMLARPGWIGRAMGGATVGVAIIAMHYTGMSAYQVQGRLIWDAPSITASILFGTGLAALASMMPLSRRRIVRRLAPATLLLAVCLAHFVGMEAVSIAFDPLMSAPQLGDNKAILALLVANAATVIVTLSLAAVWLSARNRRQQDAEDRRLADFADVAVEGLLIDASGAVEGLNQSMEAMLGLSRDQVIGRPTASLFGNVVVAAIPEHREVDAELSLAHGPIPVKVISKRITARGNDKTVLAVRDQRDRLLAEAKMARLAHQDALTGLDNRLSFNEHLAGLCASRRKEDAAFALLMLDLDRFKLVNDTLGHDTGDELLRRVAGRLTAVLRDGDLLARLGGDEFAIVAPLTSGYPDAQALAERVIDMTARPYIIDGQVLDMSASVGIALSPADGQTPGELSRHADLALYRSKEERRGTYRFFEAEMNLRMQVRRQLELDLRRAVAREEFTVVYQPQVNAKNGTFNGAEALVRWHHPERGMVSPADFIPLAEELGLIGAIGSFVLQTACAQATQWDENLSVAVNLSPVQFKDANLVGKIERILAETGLRPARLELEITENALLQDDGRTLEMLHALRALGIRISMDDFGTGYSSLSYLRRFPFDKLKIDQSFVRQLPGDAESLAIVQAITSLGNKLGIAITAEGVETQEQRSLTTFEGVDQIQGYLISRPVVAEAIGEMFAQVRRQPVAA